MKILEPYDELGWITAIIDDRWCQAKLGSLPSEYGINGSRVNTLFVGKTNIQVEEKDFLPQMDYSYYGRVLDFDTLPNGILNSILNSILNQLEALPSREQAKC